MIKDYESTYLDTDFDAHRMKRWRNDYNIYRWCRQNTLLSDSDHFAWIESLKGNKRDKMYSIHNENYEFIGVCGLTNIDYIARHAEFSLYIGPEYQGQGHAGRALFSLIKHGFDCFNMNKIWGETFHGNKAGNLFTKVGFEIMDGHYQHYFKDGMYIDTKFYYMFSRDFYEKQTEIYERMK